MFRSSPASISIETPVGAIAVINLSNVYRNYIACLNKRGWPKPGQFVDDEVIHNGRRVGLSGYLENAGERL